MSDLEEKILEILRRKQVLRMIVSEIAVDPELRYFLVQSILQNVATKEDVRELRSEINNLRNEIYRNRNEIISYIDGRISDLDKRIDALDKRISMLQ